MSDVIIQLIEARIRELQQVMPSPNSTCPIDDYHRIYCGVAIYELNELLDSIRDATFSGVEHDGKGVPREISSMTRIEVLRRNGKRHGPTQALKAWAGAEAHMFEHTGSPWDIMAYKIHH